MSEKTNISVHSPFQPLECVMLGQGIDPTFFDWIDEPKVKDPLKRIIDETNEDLSQIKKTLEQNNVKVYQNTPLKLNQDLFKNKKQIPVPPLQPRDVHLTLNDKIYVSSNAEAWNYVHQVVEADSIVNLIDEVEGLGEDIDGKLLSGAHCYRLGKRIIVPRYINDEMRAYAKNFFTQKGYEVLETDDPGHSDGIMSVLKPGLIVSYLDPQFYKKTFPNWEVFNINLPNVNAMHGWIKFKNKAKGRWWVPGEETNDYLSKFVDTWLTDWVGFIEETVFDVNMLSISEEVVLVNNEHKELFEFLDKNKITPIVCPLRHRFFWDGGIHCITVDLKRQGNLEDYFN